MRYPFIKEHQGRHRVSVLCRRMQVGRGGYDTWLKRPISQRTQANAVRTEPIQTAFEESDQTYGSPRIVEELREKAIACSETRVARLMRAAPLNAVLARRFVATTDRNHALPVADNRLERQFKVEHPNRVWTADISYVWTSESGLYLGVVRDLFSRRIVGFALGATLQRSRVLSALDRARSGRRPDVGLLCHSDRGSQYASLDYQKVLQDAGIVCSRIGERVSPPRLSRRGNGWDNAPTERVFATLKLERV